MSSLPFANAVQPVSQFLKRLTTVRTQEAKVTVGLDVGSASVKAIALGSRKGAGVRPMLGQSCVPLEAAQQTDPSEVIKTALAQLGTSVDVVNLAVSGPWVIIRIIELPSMSPAEVKQALPFEAQRYLPFNLQDVVIDGAMLGPAEANKIWVLIVACKKELIERRVDWVRRAGVEVGLIDVDALALANGFLAGVQGARKDQTCALMNVGAQLTSLVIFQGEVPYLVRDIPWGGDKLIRNAAEQVGVDAADVSKDLVEGQCSPEVLSAFTISTETLITELQLSFDYFENRLGQPPETVLVSGGLSQSGSFLQALKNHLTQTVTPWAPVQGLSGQFAVAYGLALRKN